MVVAVVNMLAYHFSLAKCNQLMDNDFNIKSAQTVDLCYSYKPRQE